MSTSTRHAVLLGVSTAATFLLVVLIPLLRDPVWAVLVEAALLAIGATTTALVPEYGGQLGETGPRHRIGE